MKGQTIISLLSFLLIASLSAQQSTPPGSAAELERAAGIIQDTDNTARETQEAVLEDTGNPELPEEPTFEVPEEDVFLDLPGGSASSTSMTADAETISVDFPQEDVRNIIRSVAELYELNVVIPETLAGSVSIKLRDVTWQQVFDVVLEPLNYTYVTEGNIIKIKSQDELAVEPVDTRVFIVDFAKAEEIRGSVQPLIDAGAGGRIQVDVRSNALVITERPSRMNDIQEIIETLDRPTEQVMIESKFVEITGRGESSVGVDWQSLIGWGLQASAGIGENAIFGRSYESTSTNEPAEASFTERVDTAVFSADAFRTVISALDTNEDIELVSNPTIVTMNNKKATINIGEEFPIPSYNYNEERGVFEVSNFEYKNIGINLDVIPQINSAGFINLDIQPEISSRTGEVEFGGASGAVIPIITTRKTNSSVTIKSGYTLAIGGLIEQREAMSGSKIPVLGDVPGLGRLFSSDGKSTDRRNLIVFITAKILSSSGATYEDVFSKKTLYEMGIDETDVPGYESNPAEQELIDKAMKAREDYERLKDERKIRGEIDSMEINKTLENNRMVEEEEARLNRRRYD